MQCPACNETLVMSERQGIEIDYCPKCRGVWLDRGELDKVIERSAAPQAPAAPPPQGGPGYGHAPAPGYGHAPAPGYGHAPAPGYGHAPAPGGYGYGHRPHKRRKSFLEELFD